ncbi:MAG: PSD1 and planctomycete cytochrome C domain-containing protein [Verrucomicrobiota bacterium]
MRSWAPSLCFLSAFAAIPASAANFSESEIAFFADEVRPILAANCFECHGGERANGPRKFKSNFQVISRAGILTGGDHGSAFDANNPSQSFLLQKISYKDGDHQMPPSGKLSDKDIATLTKWAEMGMPWTPEDADVLFEIEDHAADTTEINETTLNFWSHKPMSRPAVPKVDNETWSQNPIDAFLFAKLDENGLAPNERADKRTLIRRAYYNLTGLPPTAAEVAAFEADDSPEAWNNLVEKLLASPHYGEKWARHWLDVVRYADSNGFERDGIKGYMWRYRDYVVNAFNDDMPFDRFIREQIAGDEMDGATLDQIVAAGYNRLMQWDDEPADPVQHYYDVLDDNLRTTSEGILAMTLGCARCHDHKIDPISQEDYFSFMSFFNGMEQMKRGRANTEKFRPAGVDEEFTNRIKEYEQQLRALRYKIYYAKRDLREALVAAHPDIADRISGKSAKYRKIVARADALRTAFWHYTTALPPEDWSAVSFRAEDKGWDYALGAFGVDHEDIKARTEWNSSDIWLQTIFQLSEVPKSARFQVKHDGYLEIYLNGKFVEERHTASDGYVAIPLDENKLRVLQTGRNVIAVHLKKSSERPFFDLGFEGANQPFLSLEEVIDLRGADGIDAELLSNYRQWTTELETLEANKPEDGIEVTTIQEKSHDVPMLKLHIRGNPHSEGDEEMKLRIPDIFGGEELEASPPDNGRVSTGRRTALAEWLARPDNPRTARVMVNRIWQHQFGRGICRTSNDFGYLGEMPTHPELLDWLAMEFVESGWSIKHIQRLIMTSKAWQMSSTAQPAALAQDPQNDLFWRFNMRRLTAEEIRDSVLSAAGELNLSEIGGPSTYPPLPEVVLKTASNKKWLTSSPEEANRRSIYITVKRSLKPPIFDTFDFADTDSSCPTRFTTTVPTQALNLINGEFFNEQAENLAKQSAEGAEGKPRRQIRQALEITLGRDAEREVIDACLTFYRKLKNDHGRTDEEAMRQVCLLIFNLNEFVYLD